MKTLKVNNQVLSIKEYNGNRVVTFKDIDTVHGRAEGTAKRNFITHSRRFVEGVDYHKLQKDEIRTFGINSPRGGIVVTESGYLMLVKSFTDDLAWDVQRTLVNCYFKQVKEQPKLESPYEFVMKYYNGEPVVTLKDIEFKTKINAATLKWHIEKLTLGKDYFLLSGNELAKFKDENPKVNTKFISSLLVINELGFIKLARMLKQPKTCIEFKKKEVKTVYPTLKYATITCVDTPENPQAQKQINTISQQITALQSVIQLYNRYITVDDREHYAKVLDDVSSQISSGIISLIRMPVKTIEKIY